MGSDSREMSNKVRRLNRLVEDRYGLDLLTYKNHPEHISDISEHYREKFHLIKKLLGENALEFSAEAVRAYLISEAARMLLREIAPKRTKKRKGTN